MINSSIYISKVKKKQVIIFIKGPFNHLKYYTFLQITKDVQQKSGRWAYYPVKEKKAMQCKFPLQESSLETIGRQGRFTRENIIGGRRSIETVNNCCSRASSITNCRACGGKKVTHCNTGHWIDFITQWLYIIWTHL